MSEVYYQDEYVTLYALSDLASRVDLLDLLAVAP